MDFSFWKGSLLQIKVFTIQQIFSRFCKFYQFFLLRQTRPKVKALAPMTFFCWFPLLKIRLCKTYFRCTFSGVRGILSYFQRTSKLSKPARNCIPHFFNPLGDQEGIFFPYRPRKIKFLMSDLTNFFQNIKWGFY